MDLDSSIGKNGKEEDSVEDLIKKLNARGAKVKILKDDENVGTPAQTATKKGSQMTFISDGASQPRKSNKENIPVEEEQEVRGSTAMQEKAAAKPLQQQNLELGQEEIIDDMVPDMPADSSAFRDKELEELQKQKEEIEQEK